MWPINRKGHCRVFLIKPWSPLLLSIYSYGIEMLKRHNSHYLCSKKDDQGDDDQVRSSSSWFKIVNHLRAIQIQEMRSTLYTDEFIWLKLNYFSSCVLNLVKMILICRAEFNRFWFDHLTINTFYVLAPSTNFFLIHLLYTILNSLKILMKSTHEVGHVDLCLPPRLCI